MQNQLGVVPSSRATNAQEEKKNLAVERGLVTCTCRLGRHRSPLSRAVPPPRVTMGEENATFSWATSRAAAKHPKPSFPLRPAPEVLPATVRGAPPHPATPRSSPQGNTALGLLPYTRLCSTPCCSLPSQPRRLRRWDNLGGSFLLCQLREARTGGPGRAALQLGADYGSSQTIPGSG